MKLSKTFQTVFLATLLLGFIASASAVSASSSGSGGSPSGYEAVSTWDRYTPDIDLGGMLAVTSTQQGKREVRRNEIVTGAKADIHLGGETCVAESGWFGWNPFSDKQVFRNANLDLYVFENKNDYQSWENGQDVDYGYKQLVPTPSGTQFTATEGKCYQFTVNDAYMPESLMLDGKGDYYVATDITWRNPETNNLLDIKESSRDKGTITLLPPQGETDEPRAEISIQEGLVENKQGEYPVVYTGTDVKLNADITQGSAEDVASYEWELSTNDNADSSRGTVFQREEAKSFTKTFQETGRVTISLRLRDDFGGTQSLSRDIVVRSDGTTEPSSVPPKAILTGVPNTVETGETFSVSSSSVDEDGKILHTEWSNGAVNTDRTSYSFSEPGTKRIELTVTDTQGLKDTAVATVEVEGEDKTPSCPHPTLECGEETEDTGSQEINKPPIAESLDAPVQATKGETITAKAIVTDRDNTERELTIEWSNGDTGKTTEYTISTASNTEISYTVSDGKDSDSASATIAVTRKDTDGDGVINDNDECETVKGDRANGCPFAQEPASNPVDVLNSDFRNQISNVVETSSYLNFLNAAQAPRKVDSENIVRETLRVGSQDSQSDASYEDGELTQYFAKEAVIEEGGNTSYESEWKLLNQPFYEKTFERTFDEPGNRAYYATVYEVQRSYNYDNQSWETTSVRKVDSEKYLFEVKSNGGGGGSGGQTEGGVFGDSSTVSILIIAILIIVATLGYILWQKR